MHNNKMWNPWAALPTGTRLLDLFFVDLIDLLGHIIEINAVFEGLKKREDIPFLKTLINRMYSSYFDELAL